MELKTKPKYYSCSFAIRDNECDFNDLLLHFQEYALTWVSEWVKQRSCIFNRKIIILPLHKWKGHKLVRCKCLRPPKNEFHAKVISLDNNNKKLLILSKGRINYDQHPNDLAIVIDKQDDAQLLAA